MVLKYPQYNFVNIDTMLATLTANGFILFTGSTTAATTSTATSEIRKYVGATETGATTDTTSY